MAVALVAQALDKLQFLLFYCFKYDCYGRKWFQWCCENWTVHSAGVWYYNVGGYTPDMHCKNCGKDLK